MAWEKRGKRMYFYRSVRVGDKVKKVYGGAGAVGRVAAQVAEQHRSDRHAQLAAWHAQKARLEQVTALCEQFTEMCSLLAAATLLAGGFHRPNKQPWRRRHEEQRTIQHPDHPGRHR